MSSEALLANAPRRDRIDCVGNGYARVGVSFKIGGGGRDTGQFAAPFAVLGPCGTAALYRRRMLDAVGLYDEDFFASMEDVDLGLRAQRGGWRRVAVPAAAVCHVGSTTSGDGASAFAVWLTTRSALRPIVKTLPGRMVPGFPAPALLARCALVLVSLATGGPTVLRRNPRVWASGILAWLRPRSAFLGKRRAVRLRNDPSALRAVVLVLPLLPPRGGRPT